MKVVVRFSKDHVKMSFVVVTLFCFNLYTLGAGQTAVSLLHPNGETPNEGQQFYQLMCIATNFEPTQYQSLAWFLNGDIITWGEQLILDYAKGHMSVGQEQMNDNLDLYSYLTIHQVILTDTGKYQCCVVEGELNNFLINYSDSKIIIVNGMEPTGYYFPSAPWPICYPRVDIIVLLGTETTIGCISQKGNPPVGIELFLRNGQALLPVADVYKDKILAHETEYAINISSENNNAQYLCKIEVSGSGPLPSMMSTCLTGHILVGLIEQKIIQVPKGAEAHFRCRKPEGGTIVWSTESNIPESRMTSVDFSTSSLLTITNLRVTENNTVIRCRTEQPYGLRDEGKIIVLDHVNPVTNPPGVITVKTPTNSPQHHEHMTTSTEAADTLTPEIHTFPVTNTSLVSKETGKKISPSVLAGIIAAGSLFAIFVSALVILLLCKTKKYTITFFKKGHSLKELRSHTEQSHASDYRQENPKILASDIDEDSSFDSLPESSHRETENDNFNELSQNTNLAYQVVDLSTGPTDKRFHTSPPDIPAPSPPSEMKGGQEYSSAEAKTLPLRTTPEGYSAPSSLLPHEVHLGHTLPFDRKSSDRSSCGGNLQPPSSPYIDPKGNKSYKTPVPIPQTERRHSLDDDNSSKQVFLQKDAASFSNRIKGASNTVPPQYAIVHPDPETPTNASATRIYDSPPDSLSDKSESPNNVKQENQEHRFDITNSTNVSSTQYATVHPDPENPRKQDFTASYDSPKGITSDNLQSHTEKPRKYVSQSRKHLSRNVPDVVPQYSTVHPDPENPSVRDNFGK